MKIKKILTTPNILTMLRILISPAFFVLLLKSKIGWGLTVFILVALTDWVDGLMARSRKQKTKFGEFLDPMADKVMVALAVIVLIMKFDFPLYGLWIFSRDVISLCGSYIIYKKRKANWKANNFGKVTTFLQIITIICFIAKYTFRDTVLLITIILSISTAITYFVRGVRISLSSR